jgi:thioester reductase-like protein
VLRVRITPTDDGSRTLLGVDAVALPVISGELAIQPFGAEELAVDTVSGTPVRVPQRRIAQSEDILSLREKLSLLEIQDQEELLLELVRRHAGAVLGQTTSDAVEPNIPFLEQGLDSLTSVLLRNRLVSAIGTPQPASLLFDFPSPIALARHLRSTILEQPGEEGSLPTVDFDREAELPADIVPVATAPGSVSTAGVTRVLLTGATGFLGSFLLKELLTTTDTEVLCLMRDSEEEEAKRRLRDRLAWYRLKEVGDSDRISVVLGDLVEPNFGMEPRLYDELSRTVDRIYHVAAEVKWVYPYSLLKQTNVIGTHNILRLAAAGRTVPLNFVSSLAVFPPPPPPDGSPLRVSDAMGPANELPNGYAQTKLVAEQVVQLAQARGLPIIIHRPGLTGGDRQFGACQLNDFVWLCLKGCIQAKAAPDDVDLSFITLAPVDYVAPAIVTLAGMPELIGKTFHVANNSHISLAGVFDLLREIGYRLDSMPRNLWTTAVRVHPDNAIAPLLDLFNDITTGPHATYDVSETETALKNSGLTCPPVTRELFEKYVEFFVEVGFLSPPHTARVR